MDECFPDRPRNFNCRTNLYARLRLLRSIQSVELFVLLVLSSRNWKSTFDLIYKHPSEKFNPPLPRKQLFIANEQLLHPDRVKNDPYQDGRGFHDNSSAAIKIYLLDKIASSNRKNDLTSVDSPRLLFCLLALSSRKWITIVKQAYRYIYELFTHHSIVYAITYRGPRQGTQPWKDQRCLYVTGSIAPQIIGWDNGGPMSKKKAFYSKCGIGYHFNGNMYTRWGTFFEDEGVGVYCLRTGDEAIAELPVIPHRKRGWLAISPDFVTRDGDGGEAKCPTTRKFGDQGNGGTVMYNGIPKTYYPQCQVQMEVCDLKRLKFIQYRPSIRGERFKFTVDIVMRDRPFMKKYMPEFKRFYDAKLEYERSGKIPDEYKIEQDVLDADYEAQSDRLRKRVRVESSLVNDYDDFDN